MMVSSAAGSYATPYMLYYTCIIMYMYCTFHMISIDFICIAAGHDSMPADFLHTCKRMIHTEYGSHLGRDCAG